MKKLIFLVAGFFALSVPILLGVLIWGALKFVPSKGEIDKLAESAKFEATNLLSEGKKIAEAKSLTVEEPCRRALGTAAGRVITVDVLRAWDSVEAIYSHCWKGGATSLKQSDRPT